MRYYRLLLNLRRLLVQPVCGSQYVPHDASAPSLTVPYHDGLYCMCCMYPRSSRILTHTLQLGHPWSTSTTWWRNLNTPPSTHLNILSLLFHVKAKDVWVSSWRNIQSNPTRLSCYKMQILIAKNAKKCYLRNDLNKE